MANRTALFSQKQPGGVFTIADLNVHPGSIFFVDSTHASATNAVGGGQNPDRPLATIDYAVGLCTANKGDVIYVMPGHAETVSAAAGLAFDVAGITVIGLGTGTMQPRVTLDTIISADVDVDAANVVIDNIHFSANFADITAAIDVNATDCTIRNCRFTETAVNMNALIWILAATSTTSSRLKVLNCRCVDRDAANTHFVSFPGTSDGDEVRNCTLLGDWGTAAIGAAGVITNCVIANNLISNAATDNDACINLAATATGIVAYNAAGGGAAQANGFKADGAAKIENYYTDITDASALLDPVGT